MLVTKIISLECAISETHFQFDEIFNLILLGKQGIISPQILDHKIFLEQYTNALGNKQLVNWTIPEKKKKNNLQSILDISTLTFFIQDNRIFFKLAMPSITNAEWDIEQVYPIPSLKNNVFLAPKVISNVYGYTDTLNQIEDKVNQLNFAHRITSIKSWGLMFLQIIGYSSIVLIGLYVLRKYCPINKMCLHFLCCKIKRNAVNSGPTGGGQPTAPINVPRVRLDFDAEPQKARFHSILNQK